MPLLSIVVVTHKRSELLKRALLSVTACKEQNFEIILCSDDGCPKTMEIAKTMLRSQDSFISIPGMNGPADSRNIGAKISKGKWIMFLDDDDAFSENFISNLLKSLPNEKNKVIYFNYKKCLERRSEEEFESIRIKPKDVSALNVNRLYVKNFIPIHAMVFSSEIFFSHEFDSRLQSHEDWDLLISLLSSSVEFEWMEFGDEGPIVNICSSKMTRNKNSNTALDCLSIYRKWPNSDSKIRQLRAKQLKKLGISRFGIKIDENTL